MTAIGNISSSGVISDVQTVAAKPKPASNLPTPGQQVNTGHPQADGVQIDLSDAAKEALKAQLAQEDQKTETQQTTTGAQDISDKIAEAKRQVQGQVGIGAVSDVVDGFGNIDTAKLAELEAQQAQPLTPAVPTLS